MALRLPDNVRAKLKEPLGAFITDLSSLKGKTVICVGDQASKDALAAGLAPKLCVYDGLIQRRIVAIPAEISGFDATEIKVANKPGTLSDEAFSAVKRALSSEGRFRILVDGEEDLLALAAIIHAPEGAVVLYGQPNEGLVGVLVDGRSIGNARSLVDEMVENGC
ncbi:MAG: DUF359 domain-containing protein [Candidatus Altiarchaeota archaeon]|nr:DUF359 domain-containing protein [Candidatus Altiarchaeota archaeon]